MSPERRCFVLPEWGGVTAGGIGRAARDRVLGGSESAILLLDLSPQQVEAVRRDVAGGAEVFGVHELASDGLPAHVFPCEAHARSYRIWRALTVLGGRSSLDAVEFVDFDGPGFVTIKAARLGLDGFRSRLEVRLHGTAERTARGDGLPLLSLEDKHRVRMERYALRHADRIVAPSEAVFEEYAEEYELEGERVIEAPRVSVDVSSRGVVPTGPPLRIGFLGKLQPLKGPETLIRAALRCLERGALEVELVGADAPGRFQSSHVEELRRLIPDAQRARFRFHGEQSREAAHALLARCHGAVIPSRSETWGLAARELAEMGLPIAVTDLPAFRTGFERVDAPVERFPVDDVAALAAILAHWRSEMEGGRWRPTARSMPRPPEPSRLAPPPSRVASPRRSHPVDHPVAPRTGAASGSRVSVVLPYFEMHDYVDACLESIRLDPHPDKEIVLVDDGSHSAASRAKLGDLRARYRGDRSVRFVEQPNAGLASARNHGIRVATGGYVLPLDPDDLIVPGYLGSAVAALERRPELAFVVGISSLFRDGSAPERAADWIVPYDPDLSMLLYENGAGTAAAVFRRETLIRFPYREDLPAYEDWDLHLRLAAAEVAGEGLPIVFHRYRQRRGGLAGLGHRQHERLVEALWAPLLEGADPALRGALEIHLDRIARMRGLGTRSGSIRNAVADRIEAFYRRNLKERLRERLGPERRDLLAASARRWLRGG